MMQWDAKLDARKVKLTPAVVTPGQSYFALTVGEYLGDWGGRHNVFVDVLNEGGYRMVGHPVRFWWKDGGTQKLTEPKPGDMWSVDWPMYEGGYSYGVTVGGVSDSVFGMGLGTLDNHFGKDHCSYRFVFQRTKAGQTEPLPPAGNLALIAQAMDRLQRGQDLSNRALAEYGAAMALLNQARGE
jgi:hypothetical protein